MGLYYTRKTNKYDNRLLNWIFSGPAIVDADLTAEMTADVALVAAEGLALVAAAVAVHKAEKIWRKKSSNRNSWKSFELNVSCLSWIVV